jgi:hypothetical protein
MGFNTPVRPKGDINLEYELATLFQNMGKDMDKISAQLTSKVKIKI